MHLGPLLLLDLDGVVVFEASHPHVTRLEILLLHQSLADVLRDLDIPVVVLTHRSRAEAAQILLAAGLTSREISSVIGAEDIFRAAWASGRPWALLRQGLRKSWVLPVIEKRHGVPRERFAFIDDRLDNLRDVLGHGIGLAVHAPSAIAADGLSLTSFDFRQVARLLKDWDSARRVLDIHAVEPRQMVIEPWQKTGLDTVRQARGLFNGARQYGRLMRRVIRQRRSASG
jgi:hypothetical protein